MTDKPPPVTIDISKFACGGFYTDRHTPYCPLSQPVFERGMPEDYDPDEFPYQCTCHAEGRDS